MGFLEKADLLSRALRRAPTYPFFYRDRRIRKRILRGNRRCLHGHRATGENRNVDGLMPSAVSLRAERCRKALSCRANLNLIRPVKRPGAWRSRIESSTRAMRERLPCSRGRIISLLRFQSRQPAPPTLCVCRRRWPRWGQVSHFRHARAARRRGSARFFPADRTHYICGLRLALASGISTVTETWPSG